MSVAVYLNITLYVDAKLSQMPLVQTQRKRGQSLLHTALNSETSITGDWAKATCYKQRYKDIIEVLLKHGTDPDFLINRFSPSGWEMVVSYKMPLDPETYMKFLRCGADPEADLTYLREKGSKWQPVLELQKELQEKSPKSRKKTSYTSWVRILACWGQNA